MELVNEDVLSIATLAEDQYELSESSVSFLTFYNDFMVALLSLIHIFQRENS